MSRVLVILMVGVLLVTAAFRPSEQSNAQGATPRVIVRDETIPGSNNVKYPYIAAFRNVVHAAGNPSRKAAHWDKVDVAQTWPDPTILGDARGQSDYASAAVATDAQGGVYVVWIDRDTSRMYLRRRPAGSSTFEDQRTIGGFVGFGVFPSVAVAGNGQIFVVWNDNNRFRYRVSSDGGFSWTGISDVSDQQAVGRAFVAAGTDANVLVGFYSEGKVFAARWMGDRFVTERVDRGGNYFADPTAAVAPNGNMYLAWRGVSDGEVFYVERQATDTEWRPPSRLARGGEVGSAVSISADAENNLHVFWIRVGGDLWYRFKPANEPWRDPIPTSSGGFNALGVGTAVGRVYAHAVHESFTGAGLRTRYTLIDTGVDAGPPPTPTPTITPTPIPLPTGELQINNGATFVNTANVSVRITATNADQYRLSNDGVKFTEYAPIPAEGVVPWALEPAPAGTTACVNRTVYGQLRHSSSPAQETDILQAAIAIDPGIDAEIFIRNPYHAANPTVYDMPQMQEFGVLGAAHGDPRYTRIPLAFVEARGLVGECSGLNTITVNNYAPVGIQNNYFGMPLGLKSGVPNEGPHTMTVTLTDKAGHPPLVAEQTIFYDATPPRLTSGNARIVNSAGQEVSETSSVIVNLSFESMVITDNLYGRNGESKPFWGVWLANSRQNIATENTQLLNTLNWSSIEVPTATNAGNNTFTFTMPWSILSGLPRNQWQGGATYYVYARVLDGAGNPSTETIKYEVTLRENFDLPKIYLPLIRR